MTEERRVNAGKATAYIDGEMLGAVTELMLSRERTDELREALDQKVLGDLRDRAIVAGIPFRAVEWLPEDVAFAVGRPPRSEPPPHVGYNSNHLGQMRGGRLEFDTYDEYERAFGPRDLLRFSMTMAYETAPVLVRPSWLHPFRRTLWVHHHGPQCPEVVPTGGAHRMVKRPTWLHPIKRTLWVHRYGPGVPEQKKVIRVSRMASNSMAVITGVTG